MKKQFWCLCALLGFMAWSLAVPPRSAHAQDSKEEMVVELVMARLSVMREVAAFKYGNDLPIEDPARETVVLDKSREKAAALGLDGESVLPFFEQQIEAAKVIQTCWMARWRNGSHKALRFPRDLPTELRPQLIEIGDRINETLATALVEGKSLDDGRLTKARPLLALDCLPPETGDAVIESLASVKAVTP